MKNAWIVAVSGLAVALVGADVPGAADKALPNDNKAPSGYTALFNGKNLENWQGLVELPERKKHTPEALAKMHEEANAKYLPHWQVKNGILHYDGHGQSLQTIKDYRNIDLWVDWKITKGGDSGIYLRGNPQVQIWDNPEGSGGLYNNQHHAHIPLWVADKPPGQWNRFHIIMRGDRVTVWLNGIRVVNNTPLENYWERGKPLPATGPIELQHHWSPLEFKNIYVKELPTEVDGVRIRGRRTPGR